MLNIGRGPVSQVRTVLITPDTIDHDDLDLDSVLMGYTVRDSATTLATPAMRARTTVKQSTDGALAMRRINPLQQLARPLDRC